MKLIRINTFGLFDLYNYSINLDSDERLTVLTGPNGYGKTTILSIINNLYRKNFYFFCTLVFQKIEFYFEKDYKIIVEKISNENSQLDNHISDGISNIVLKLLIGSQESSVARFDIDAFYEIINRHYDRIGDDFWEERYSDQTYSTIDILEHNPSLLEKTINNEGAGDFFIFLNSLNSCFIKEKRLTSIYQPTPYRKRREKRNNYLAIQKVADELSDKITQSRLKSIEYAQRLESTFPERLLQTTEILDPKLYKDKSELLQEKLTSLREYGLSDMYLSNTEYANDENKRILTVYLNDTEKKALQFDDLLSQIKLFVQIINRKQFASKTIYVDSREGFGFKTIKNKNIRLDLLSSGEQHEVIMIYDLLFLAHPNTLVLIDEPEISLHVGWQQEFINDMTEIAKMRKLELIIATHSPQIVGANWHLCKDLYELNNL